LIAYTFFNGYEYGGTLDQVENNDFYTLDVDGIKYFQKFYTGKKSYKIIYIDVPESVCRVRMYNRGDTHDKVEERVANDRKAFKEAPELADIVIENNFFNTCIDDVYKYICKCEGWSNT